MGDSGSIGFCNDCVESPLESGVFTLSKSEEKMTRLIDQDLFNELMNFLVDQTGDHQRQISLLERLSMCPQVVSSLAFSSVDLTDLLSDEPELWNESLQGQPRTQRKISLSDAEYAQILARYGIAANQSESNALRQALGLSRLAHGGARPGAGRPEQAK